MLLFHTVFWGENQLILVNNVMNYTIVLEY